MPADNLGLHSAPCLWSDRRSPTPAVAALPALHQLTAPLCCALGNQPGAVRAPGPADTCGCGVRACRAAAGARWPRRTRAWDTRVLQAGHRCRAGVGNSGQEWRQQGDSLLRLSLSADGRSRRWCGRTEAGLVGSSPPPPPLVSGQWLPQQAARCCVCRFLYR